MSVVAVPDRQQLKTLWKKFHSKLQMLPADSEINTHYLSLKGREAKQAFMLKWKNDPQWTFVTCTKSSESTLEKASTSSTGGKTWKQLTRAMTLEQARAHVKRCKEAGTVEARNLSSRIFQTLLYHLRARI